MSKKFKKLPEAIEFLQQFTDSFYEIAEISEENAPEDVKFLKEAFEEALKGNRESETPIGAVVALGDKILAKAHNQVEAQRDPTMHAELIAIKKALEALESVGDRSHRQGRYLEGATLYVTLEPCLMCFSAASLARIHRIVFLTYREDGFLSYPVKSAYPRQITRITGSLEKQYTRLIKSFFKELRKS